uniref:Nucleotid_trans domain-containing protein n=1 Tax=Heterorhabditis bacteriophora TaxID=37862 RepID=A0A1I7XDE7_HETBA
MTFQTSMVYQLCSLRNALRASGVIFSVIIFLILTNVFKNIYGLMEMNVNEKEFQALDLLNYGELQKTVQSLPPQYGVILLNRHALDMTLNWLCNTLQMEVHERILFFVLDEAARQGLKRHYPYLKVVQWNAPSLQKPFRPYDSTYMSFFLMRTNLIQALQHFGKEFWMLQADTIWREPIFPHFNESLKGDILLDQQGYADTAESSVRKRMMNGANFLVSTKESSRKLVSLWLSWQKWVYITDPDVIKMLCLSGDFNCEFIPHQLISGWEWIYGDQRNPPIMIQMDGETEGNKMTTKNVTSTLCKGHSGMLSNHK